MSWADFGLDLWSHDQTRTALLLLTAGLFFSLLTGRHGKPDAKVATKITKPPRIWCWPWQRRGIPWKLGSVTVDLRGGHHTVHAVVAGMSGTGKSTAVLPLLMGKMPALVIAFDNSRPIRDLFHAKGWTIWQPGGGLGWDILKGSAQVVSEALTAGFARTDQDVGYNRGLARMRLWETMDDLDARGIQRSINALVEALEQPGRNPDETRACRTWANRFRQIAKSLGPSLGTDLDLGDCLARGEKVLILPNRFLSPEDAPLIGAIALVQARRVAQEVGDFLVIVEEAGQAGARQKEMNALAQAGRDRGCPLIVITQNAAKLPDEVVNNAKVWITFAQESRHELAFAAERLRVDPLELQPERMPTGHAWVRSPDVNPRRVKLSLPRIPRNVGPSQADDVEVIPTERSYQRGSVAGMLNGWYPNRLALPAPRREVPVWVGNDPDRKRAMESLKRDTRRALMWHPAKGFWWGKPCLLWVAGGRKERPAMRIGEKTVTTYIEVFKWAGGIIPESFTLDHLCAQPRCCEPDHLDPCSIAENNQRRSARKRAMSSVDLTQVAAA